MLAFKNPLSRLVWRYPPQNPSFLDDVTHAEKIKKEIFAHNDIINTKF